MTGADTRIAMRLKAINWPSVKPCAITRCVPCQSNAAIMSLPKRSLTCSVAFDILCARSWATA